MLALSAIENKGHGAENGTKERATATQPHKAEKELPRIVQENPQIFELLDGHIDARDTLATMQKKLARKLAGMTANIDHSDDLSYYVAAEMKYQQQRFKMEGTATLELYTRLERERTSTKSLEKFFKTLKVGEMNEMNDAIITYYNQIGGERLSKKQTEQYIHRIEKERTKLGYTYQDVEKWVAAYEKRLAKTR